MTPFFDNRWMIPSIAIAPMDMRGRVHLQAGHKTTFDLPLNVTSHGEC